MSGLGVVIARSHAVRLVVWATEAVAEVGVRLPVIEIGRARR